VRYVGTLADAKDMAENVYGALVVAHQHVRHLRSEPVLLSQTKAQLTGPGVELYNVSAG